MKLDAQTAAITGGARGIGLAAAQALVARGCRVALIDVSEEALRTTLPVLPGNQVMLRRCDVSRAAEVEAAAADIQEKFGPISIWINNAGLARHRWIPDYTESEIDLMLAVNLKGTILGS